MIRWNDMLTISCISNMYHCDICSNLIVEKSCKAIRVNEKNYYIHDGHIAVDNANWIHHINKELNGQSKTI